MAKRTSSKYIIIIQNQSIKVYCLDTKAIWEMGRKTNMVENDILLGDKNDATICDYVSRIHGRFRNMDGFWFYVDALATNGTYLNGRKIVAGANGRVKPHMLSDGDTFVFGARESLVINRHKAFGLFLDHGYDNSVIEFDSKGLTRLSFTDGDETYTYTGAAEGMVINTEKGVAIYMGDKTYLWGDMRYVEKC